MVESAPFPAVAARGSAVSDSSRHPALVRITHWITAFSFLGLLVSGIAILLAHPRLYWGETGAVGTPSLIDLPLPFMLTGQSGWGRSLHFLTAWISVLTGLIYVVHGMFTQHFRTHLLPAQADLAWRSIAQAASASAEGFGETRRSALCARRRSNHLRLRPGERDAPTYNVLQRLTYLAVVFILFPLMIWTGLAMSPAMTSVVPVLVDALSGQQSARTIHFLAAGALVLFFIVHLAMVCRAGFAIRMRRMITGQGASEEV
jgi:thiosulfate reductase cytochrome b subunit